MNAFRYKANKVYSVVALYRLRRYRTALDCRKKRGRMISAPTPWLTLIWVQIIAPQSRLTPSQLPYRGAKAHERCRAAVHSLRFSVGSSAHSHANAPELERMRARAACCASRPLADVN